MMKGEEKLLNNKKNSETRWRSRSFERKRPTCRCASALYQNVKKWKRYMQYVEIGIYTQGEREPTIFASAIKWFELRPSWRGRAVFVGVSHWYMTKPMKLTWMTAVWKKNRKQTHQWTTHQPSFQIACTTQSRNPTLDLTAYHPSNSVWLPAARVYHAVWAPFGNSLALRGATIQRPREPNMPWIQWHLLSDIHLPDSPGEGEEHDRTTTVPSNLPFATKWLQQCGSRRSYCPSTMHAKSTKQGKMVRCGAVTRSGSACYELPWVCLWSTAAR